MKIVAYMRRKELATDFATYRSRHVRNWLAVHLRGWTSRRRALPENA